MDSSPEETAKAFRKIALELQREVRNNPEKARQVLLDAGILVKSKSDPTGVKLAKRYRSAG